MSIDQPTNPSYTELAEQQFATVRERLIERRRELGMTMSALARQIGVSPSMISQIERGQSLPSVETLFALAAALGLTVDTFFSASGTTQSPELEQTERETMTAPYVTTVRGAPLSRSPTRARRDRRAGRCPLGATNTTGARGG